MENKMKRISMFSFFVLGLVLFLSGVVSAQPGRDCPGPGKCMDDLKLTKDQETKIEALRLDHQKKMIDLRSDLEKTQLEMKQLLAKGDYSRADYLALTAKLGKAREALQTSRANHQMDIYDLLDKDQKATWNKFRADRPGKGGMGMGMGQGKGYGKGFHKGFKDGYGRGMGRGYGKGFRDGRCLNK